MKIFFCVMLAVVGCSASISIPQPSYSQGAHVDNGCGTCGNPLSDVFQLVNNFVQPIVRHSSALSQLQTPHVHSSHTPQFYVPIIHTHHRLAPAKHIPLHRRLPYIHHLHRHQVHRLPHLSHHIPPRRMNLLHRLMPRLQVSQYCDGNSCYNTNYSPESSLSYPKMSLSKASSLMTNNGLTSKLYDSYYR